MFFFFKQKTAYEMRISDWSSDVCSSDLQPGRAAPTPGTGESDSVRTDGAKLTLRGTLHYLWEQAGFNRWAPAMSGKRSWGVIRKYILQAAADKTADRKSTRLNSSHYCASRMPSSA